MSFFHKMAVIFSVLWIAAATTMTPTRAQGAALSEGEQLALGACLVKCADGDQACNNRCISRSQINGRVWTDSVRTCIRGCRNGHQLSPATAQAAADGILGCIAG